MKNFLRYFFIILLAFQACSSEEEGALTAFGVYCEMVANGAKPIALHQPMDAAVIDKWWIDYQTIAQDYGVELYREDDFPTSLLFPSEMTTGKTVVLIYKGKRLVQYKMWKTDAQNYKGNDPNIQEGLARRFGRILGYNTQGINELLSNNTPYRNLASANVAQQVTHLYYADVEAAKDFYQNTLGLNQPKNALFQISNDAFIEVHPFNEAHPEGQAKSTAIALLTNQLPAWYKYAQEKGIPIKYTYKPKDGGPHDGFVAIDPGGYLLEFEEFKQHPENELFMTILSNAPKVKTAIQDLNFFGSITWTYHKDLLKMQQFYEEALGYQLVADQGWTKIYQTSPTGFIGLVDECRGMEDYAETKAIELEWQITNMDAFNTYATQFWEALEYRNQSLIGPEGYIYHIKGKE